MTANILKSYKNIHLKTHITPLRHIILIPSKPVFLFNAVCLAEKEHIPILLFLVLPDRGEHTNHYTTDGKKTSREQCDDNTCYLTSSLNKANHN